MINYKAQANNQTENTEDNKGLVFPNPKQERPLEGAHVYPAEKPRNNFYGREERKEKKSEPKLF